MIVMDEQTKVLDPVVLPDWPFIFTDLVVFTTGSSVFSPFGPVVHSFTFL